jgi:hypothetical protein
MFRAVRIALLVSALLLVSGCTADPAATTSTPSIPPPTTMSTTATSVPTTLATSTTASSSTTTSIQVGEAPRGLAIIVGSFPTSDPEAEGNARTLADRVRANGFEAGVVASSDFPSLNPGYWVVYSGYGMEDEADAHQADLRAKGYADAYLAEFSDTTIIRPKTLAGLDGQTYLPVISSCPGKVSNIELRREPGGDSAQGYSFHSVWQGHLFNVTVGPSYYFEWSEEDAVDPKRMVDISSSVMTPTGINSRVIIYSETAPRATLEAFVAELAIPGVL